MTIIPKVYETNERVILEGESPFGIAKIAMVGALNVGSIKLTNNQYPLEKIVENAFLYFKPIHRNYNFLGI